MNIENNNNNLINKNTISVKIGNIKYNLSTNENEEYINGIVKYINSKMDELSSIYDTLNKNSTSFLLVLALNIADDLFKQRQEFNKVTKSMSEFEKNISSLTNQLAEFKDKIETLQANNNSKEETISFLENKLKNLDNQNEDQIESLKNEKDDIISSLEQKLSSVIQDKDVLTEEKDNLISNLENKISTLLEEKNNISLNINSKLDAIVSEKDKVIFNLKQSLDEKNLIIDNLKDNLNETTTKLSSNNTEDIILEKDIKILELEEEIEKLKARINN